ncbi:MAG: cytochrome c oxidase subunit 2A [Balneolaceae bacterium]|nr:cytochrome c oxidase subunit 2A [Balneolaceae bacterium]
MGNNESNGEVEEFRPKGAIAFFIVLILFFAVVWFALYFELLSRG